MNTSSMIILIRYSKRDYVEGTKNTLWISSMLGLLEVEGGVINYWGEWDVDDGIYVIFHTKDDDG